MTKLCRGEGFDSVGGGGLVVMTTERDVVVNNEVTPTLSRAQVSGLVRAGRGCIV